MNTPAIGRIHQTILTLLAFLVCSAAIAEEIGNDKQQKSPLASDGRSMTAERLGELIVAVDEDAIQNGNSWFFHTAELETVVVFDTNADRMRILIPVAAVDELQDGELLRLMQANFDSALDARYAIAQGALWGAYIHPLSTLSAEEFLIGLGQTANVVISYGESYSSGLFLYGNGDSAEIERNRLIEELKNVET